MPQSESERKRAERRRAADRGDPELYAEFQRDMDREVERQRVQADKLIAAARGIPPITDWAEVAATVSDEVWERILNDMPVSRRDLERIRPSRNARRLPDA